MNVKKWMLKMKEGFVMNECVKIIMNVKKCIKLTYKWIIERQIPSFGTLLSKN